MFISNLIFKKIILSQYLLNKIAFLIDAHCIKLQQEQVSFLYIL